MPTARRTVSRRPARRGLNKSVFRARLAEFLHNKAVAAELAKANQGDKDKGNGIRDYLLAEVMEHGEKDPETGSFFLELDSPVEVEVAETRERYQKVKAERRQGTKYLNVDRAREFLAEKDLLDQVEEFVYTLRLDAALAEQFGEWLKESGLVEKLAALPQAVLVEDNLLALHQKRDPKGKLGADGKKPRLISEDELDALYDVPDPTWALVPQKG